MTVSGSEALGSLVYPQDVEVGKEYFFSRGAHVPMIKAKVIRVNVSPFPLAANGWRNRVIYKIGLEDQPDFKMIWNPEGELTLETHLYKIYEIIDTRNSPQIQAQTNVLRNLGRYGKIPMNIAIGKIPGYLGLGGKSRRMKRGRRGTKRRYKRCA